MIGLSISQRLGKQLLVWCNNNCNERTISSKLVEIGRFSIPNEQTECYRTGQLFVNKVLAYRGIIIYPWAVYVYKKDSTHRLSGKENVKADTGEEEGRNVSLEYYYQVFVDARDRPFIKEQIDYNNYTSGYIRELRSVPGLDYVAHEDILPYTASEKVPLRHELIDKFFTLKPEKGPLTSQCKQSFKAKDHLYVWLMENWYKLKVSKVHKEKTKDIMTTVIPFFMGHNKTGTIDLYSWIYRLCFQNLSHSPIVLKSHSWKIFSDSDLIKTVNGVGMIGQEVTLDKTDPVIQYIGHVSLQKPYGRVCGTFKAIKEDGSSIDCHVPLFFLNDSD